MKNCLIVIIIHIKMKQKTIYHTNAILQMKSVSINSILGYRMQICCDYRINHSLY